MEEIPKSMIVPPELEFKPSSAEHMKIGVWSKCDINKDEKYGPFEGEKKKLSAVKDDTYSWEIRGPKGRRIFSIDASDPRKGNWMRYVKSARFFDEQNMIAVQEDKHIFYKTLRMIPKGEELLCWYKGERPPANGARSSTKLEESYKEATNIASVLPDGDGNSNGVSVDKDKSSTGCSDKKPDSGNEVISLTSQQNISNSDIVHGACIRLSGLTDSIQRMITTTTHCTDVDRLGREPVVRLVPLSAEIKLKVHLDLDIHLDSELRTKFEPNADEKTGKTEIQHSDSQQLSSTKSFELEVKGNTTVSCEQKVSDSSKYNTLSSPPTCSKDSDKNSIVLKEEQDYPSDFSKLGCSSSNTFVKEITKGDSGLHENHEIPLPKASTCDENLSGDLKPPDIHSIELKREPTCLANEQTANVVCQELPDSLNVKNEHQCQEEKKQLDLRDQGVEDKSPPQVNKVEDKPLCPGEFSDSLDVKNELQFQEEKKPLDLRDQGVEDKSPPQTNKVEDKPLCPGECSDSLDVKNELQFQEEKKEEDVHEEDPRDQGMEDKSPSKTDKIEENQLCPGELPDSLDVKNVLQCQEEKKEQDLREQDSRDQSEENKNAPKTVKVEENSLCPGELSGSLDVKNELQFQEEKKAQDPRGQAVEDTSPPKTDKVEKKPLCSDAIVKVDLPETGTTGDQNVAVKRDNVTASGKKYKFPLKKYRKRYRCQQCSRDFRKPFQLKMHIIRAHEKRERRFKGYKISKRETIRTRSISYLETAIHEAEERSLIPEESYGSEVANSHQESVNYQAAAVDTVEPVGDKVPSDLTVNQSQLSVKANFSQEKLQESFECPVCRRTFQYKSWLSRHMMGHQKIDSVEEKPIVPIAEKKIDIQYSREATQRNENSRSNSFSEFHIPKYDHSNIAEIQSKPFVCSECGKRFTTKKNTRRHKRLIHNILVRPDRTKLHYSNYTVEKPYTATNLRAPKKIGISAKKLCKSGKVLNRSSAPEYNSNKAHTNVEDRHSPGISVRLFDPSQLRLSETTVPQTKIQWRVSSCRTGPPPAVETLDVDTLYRQKLKQEAAFTGIAVRNNQWMGTCKPNPFIPKTQDEDEKGKGKIASHAKLDVPSAIVSSRKLAGDKRQRSDKETGAIRSFGLSSADNVKVKVPSVIASSKKLAGGKRQRSDEEAGTIRSFGLSTGDNKQTKPNSRGVKIKEEPKELVECPDTTLVSNARQSLTDTADTDKCPTVISNLKRKLKENDTKETNPRSAVVERKLEQRTFPNWPAQSSFATPRHASTVAASRPTQIQPLTSNFSQLQKQQQPVSTPTLPELDAQIKSLQKR
ncbi:uncharacterized protein [Amphiura filiformis]|uniref:uncharacterized protein n=1 Tax=Amphiura filiformis TaxID=82378 RepID=UPI003B216161